MHHTELELILRAPTAGEITADLLLRPPGDTIDSSLATNAPVSIELNRLLESSPDPDEYGRALTAQLFASPEMREAWYKVIGYVQGARTRLRVRLRIEQSAEHLHAIRWELLQNPAIKDKAFLTKSPLILFARYLDSDDLSTIVAPALSDVRALVAIANPSDLQCTALTRSMSTLK